MSNSGNKNQVLKSSKKLIFIKTKITKIKIIIFMAHRMTDRETRLKGENPENIYRSLLIFAHFNRLFLNNNKIK